MLVLPDQRSRRQGVENRFITQVLSYISCWIKFARKSPIFLIFVGALASIPDSLRGADGKFSITTDQKVVDFGDVTVGQTVSRAIRINNPTSQPVQVAADSDCKCLLPVLKASDLQPGGDSTLQINLDTCSGSVGEVRRHVYLRTQTPPGVIAVPIRYHVRESVFAEPEVVSLGLFEDSSKPVEGSIRSLDDQPLELVRAAADSAALSVEIEQHRVDRYTPGRLVIRASGTLPIGPLQATVLVETTHPRCPRIRIGVTGERTVGLSVDPLALRVGAIQLNASPPQTLRIAERNGSRVRGVHSTSSSLQIRSFKRDSEGSEVVFAFDPILPLGTVTGLLTLEVEDKDVRRVSLRCAGQFIADQSDVMNSNVAAPPPRNQPCPPVTGNPPAKATGG